MINDHLPLSDIFILCTRFETFLNLHSCR